MKRKRAPGGGRKSRAGPTSSLTFRIPDDMRQQLESEAAAKNATVSERLLWHLSRSFNRQREEERDPALQGLLLLIARLAEQITGGELMPDKGVRSAMRREWRTDLFNFRAFKAAVNKLLDALDEPPASEDPLTEEQREEIRRESIEKFGSEFTKMFEEMRKSPESYGAWVFGDLWTRFTKSHLPFTENERRMMVKHPVLGQAWEREYFDFQKARKALELKPPREDLADAIRRIMKDRGLSENDPPPPDILEAIKLIADTGRARREAAEATSALEAIKAFPDPLPTLDEALKLIKTRKAKGRSR
jgi:hypothetical protein